MHALTRADAAALTAADVHAAADRIRGQVIATPCLHSRTLSALTGAEIAALLTDAGLEATLTEDARTGTPVAQGQIGSYIFVVRGMECSGAPTACGALLFFANFGMGAAPSQADFEAVNRFNDSQLYGRAYIIASRNEVGVDYVIELDGGVSMDNLSRNVAPAQPFMELHEIVCAHQPDEAVLWVSVGERPERVAGVAGACLALEIRQADRRARRHRLGRGEAGLERGHVAALLERIAGRDQPPHLVQCQRPGSEQADAPMPAMRGIEAAAKQSGEAGLRRQGDQGRVWPCPRTCHL